MCTQNELQQVQHKRWTHHNNIEKRTNACEERERASAGEARSERNTNSNVKIKKQFNKRIELGSNVVQKRTSGQRIVRKLLLSINYAQSARRNINWVINHYTRGEVE